MKWFTANCVLMVGLVLATGTLDAATLVAGFTLGYFALGLVHYAMGKRVGYGTRGWRLLRFAPYFTVTLVRANLQVAWEVLTPRHNMRPRILRYNIEGLSEVQVTALSNAITLTPGTLSMDISDDGRFMYVHCMYAADPQQALRALDELRRRVTKEVFK